MAALRSATAAHDTPESHQTSRMSCSRRKAAPPHLPQRMAPMNSVGSCVYQASMPSCAKESATRRMISGETSGSLQASQ